MAGEFGVVLKVVEPVKSFVFDAVIEYVRYIGSCEENLGSLHRNLSDVCNKKDDINKKVKDGEDKNEEITREAGSWLKDVRILTEDEELKILMYKDMETAKLVVKMMGKKDLKKRLSKESEMQELVVKVMKQLKEEMDESEEEIRKMKEVDYKKVAEVVVEVMKDTIEEFKKLIKEDNKIALIATRMLKDRDLDKLTEGDKEMEEIVREAGNVSDEELWYTHEDENQEESSALLSKLPVVKNPVKEAANKLFTPLGNLLTPLGKLMDDANFKKSVPGAEGVKLGLEVIDGLLLKKGMNDNTKQHRGCCCSTSILCDYHEQYLISKAAELMTKHIQDDIISKCPSDPVTLPKRIVDLKPIPTQFLKGLDSRTKLLQQILERLKDDQVDAVGVFGMGGTGKTTLAKEVNKRAKDTFSIKVMVEVSDAPDIVRIQGAIADSIGLPLHDVDNAAQRAVRLYNRLISEKEKKILVILDNVWRELNLDEIGIPRTCKLLLTTRERDVCRVMGVQDANMLEVGVMNANESRDLFRNQAGNQVDDREYKNVVDRLLNKCGGLPLAIVATANSLKDKDLPGWEKFVDELEKPISSRVVGDYRHIYSILDSSYKFIEDDGKRIFFLLACLSPLGSSVSIESLIRYGIGLNLFQHVNKLCEAMEQAGKWANELALSSMLLEGDSKGDFKIHDIVRAFAISSAATVDGHKFMVEAIPRWLDDETFKKYTAISLTSRNDYTRLSGVKADKLQILILKGELLPNFTNSFFKGMVNLEVLALSNMDLRPSLPKSMRKLKKLRTLCLEGCRLGDIKEVGELINLLVLSLHESVLEELSGEIGNLCKLRLLDLTGCTCNKLSVLPIGRLSKLEGLYMFNSGQVIFETKSNNEGTSATDNNMMPYLNALEIKVPQIELLSIDDRSIQNLDKFKVCIQDSARNYEAIQLFSRVLDFDGIDDVGGVLEKSCLKALLKKTICLGIQRSENFENLVPQLNQEGFRELSSLTVSCCSDVKCIVKGASMNDSIAFPHLQYLKLFMLDDVKMVCDREASPGSFSNLQELILISLDELLYVLPLDLLPRNLNKMYVNSCKSLNFVFIENSGTHVIELPYLKSLELVGVPNLLSLVGPEKFSNTCDDVQEQILFNGEVVFPSLELFELTGCENVVKLWRREICNSGFQNLKKIKIDRCAELSSVGSALIFSVLVQLETLSITECGQICDIITLEEADESINCSQIIVFPKLKLLELGSLRNLESFYGGGSKLDFPELKKLKMYALGRMNRFANLENSSSLFHEKIAFPHLEELHVRSVNDEVMGLWNWTESSVGRGTISENPAPMLRKLMLGSTRGLLRVPSVISENLSSLTLTEFSEDDVLFSSSKLSAKQEFMWTYSQLPNLEELKVDDSTSLKELFENEDSDGSYSLTGFCGQIKRLELSGLPKLNPIPLHLFKGLGSLTLSELNWEYVISADMLGESLEQLEYLSIKDCEKMKLLVIKGNSVIGFPRLKKLELSYLDSVTRFSSTPGTTEATLLLPSLESLQITKCPKLEHFWSGVLIAPRLQNVAVRNCNNMQGLFIGNPDRVIELPSLQKMLIRNCRVIKLISSGPLTSPKLREVDIAHCHNMQRVLQVDPNHHGDLQLPFLEDVEIEDCPNILSFSVRRVVAPSLTQIVYDDKKYSMLQFEDLNHFLNTINFVDNGEELNVMFGE